MIARAGIAQSDGDVALGDADLRVLRNPVTVLGLDEMTAVDELR
jgi:hypothetical protein